MTMQGKEIKFKFAVDEHSFSRVKNYMEQLTKAARELVEAMQAGSQFLTGTAGKGRKPGQQTGNIQTTTVIAVGFEKDSKLIQKLSQDAQNALKNLTTAIGAEVKKQVNDLDLLDKKLSSIVANMQALHRMAGMAPPGVGGIMRGGDERTAVTQVTNVTQTATTQTATQPATAITQPVGVPVVPGAAVPQAGGGGFLSGISNALGIPIMPQGVLMAKEARIGGTA